MFTFPRNWVFLEFAAACALLASVPAFADELSLNGAVGPNEPILMTVGSKRVVAFYVADGGSCGVHAVVWDRTDTSGGSAARVQVTLNPRQMVHIGNTRKSLDLQCGDNAKSLAIVNNTKVIAGAAQ